MKSLSLTLIVLALLLLAALKAKGAAGWAVVALIYAGFWFWDTRHAS